MNVTSRRFVHQERIHSTVGLAERSGREAGVRFASFLIFLILTSGSSAQIVIPSHSAPEPAVPLMPAVSNGMEANPSEVKKELDKDAVISNLKKIVNELSSRNSPTSEAAQEYSEYYYKYYAKRKLDVQIKAFEWQQSASEKLIWLVVLLSVSGVVFSGFQLWKATQVIPGQTNPADMSTDMRISAKEVRVTSSVVGLIVLLISIVYLYLFLREVYTISVIPSASAAAQSANAAPSTDKTGNSGTD